MTRPNPIDPNSDLYKAFTSAMSPRLRLAWDLAEETGLRVSDIINLKAKNIHPEGIAVKERKTGKARWVTPSVDLVNRLHEAAKSHKSEYCFPSPWKRKNHIHRDTLGKELRAICDKLETDWVLSMHSARKNYAIHYYQTHHYDPVAVQHELRHDRLETTLLYLFGAPVAH